MTRQTPPARPIPFKRPARTDDPLPAAGSRLMIDEILPNGDLIVSDGQIQFRLSGLTFVPA